MKTSTLTLMLLLASVAGCVRSQTGDNHRSAGDSENTPPENWREIVPDGFDPSLFDWKAYKEREKQKIESKRPLCKEELEDGRDTPPVDSNKPLLPPAP